ncbi:CRISPR-associated helicase Cas3' [Nicoliella lavandulae]|uniref:CRISPR-associated helicase Cas3 n=1 Tax=Nicoliella lavandulae TaxID=3082954 RepID=A0ABU8SMF9_9LACO
MDETLWAKKSIGNDGLPKWLPLKQHLLDTSFTIKMLYRKYLSDNQQLTIKKAISDSYNNIPVSELDEKAEQLVKFIALLHDIGKATPAFQSKDSYRGIRELDLSIKSKLIQNGFFPSDDTKIPTSKFSPHALAGEAILKQYGVNDEIGSIIGGHHGMPVTSIGDVKRQLPKYPINYYFSNVYDRIHERWERIQKDYFQWALKESGLNTIDNIPSIKSFGSQVILEGLLVMADWVASNENYFGLFNMDQVKDGSNRYKNGWLKWFKTFKWEPEIYTDANDYYNDRFGFDPHKLQKQLFSTIDDSIDPGVFIIEAGMGTGKTEAALSSVEQLAQKKGCSGLFWALPTQATTNAMFGRVEAWCEKIAASSDTNVEIQLVHGKAALNDSFTKIPHSIDINEDENAGVLVNGWFSGNKKAILDDFVVGTIDQLLLLALKKKHLELRHLGFSQKVVVIDEAHSFDAYMQEYLYRSLNWLGKYGVPVVILSATLPSDKRLKMINSYLGISGADDYNQNNAYPLITYTDGNKVSQISVSDNIDSKNVKLNKFNGNLLDELKSVLSDGGVAGIIVNTVKRAQQIAKDMIEEFGEDSVELLHSSFIATDRSNKEKNLLLEIGKDNSHRPYKKIIVGTQVLEQSLDIDFDILFTDLAPMDLLMQRIGRLQRHENNNSNRPSKLKKPQVYVLQTDSNYEFDSGSIAIYGELLLIRTQYYLPSIISIPRDLSCLVQSVYNLSSDITNINLDLPNDFDAKYKRAKDSYQELINDKRKSAKTYMIKKYEKNKDNLIGWINKSKDELSDSKGDAEVRDGEENIEVIVLWKTKDDNYKLLNGKMISNSDLEIDQITKNIATNTIKLPVVMSKSYNIDKTIDELEKFNKKYLPNWQMCPWLRGSLGILLDENNDFIINGYKLHYDKNLGMMYNKIE